MRRLFSIAVVAAIVLTIATIIASGCSQGPCPEGEHDISGTDSYVAYCGH